MLASSYFKRLLHGGAWTLLGTGLARASTFVMMAVLARMLGTEDFGSIGILQSTLGVIGTFAGLGLSNTALRYIAAHKDDDRERCGRIIALLLLAAGASGMLATFTGVLIAPWLAGSILVAPDLAVPLMIGSPVLMFSLVAGVHSGTLIGLQRFQDLAIVNLLDGLIGVLLTLLLVYLLGFLGFALALLLKSILLWATNLYYARNARRQHGICIQWRIAWAERNMLLQFSLPAFLCSLSYAPIMWAGQTLLVRNAGYDQLGLFLAAAQINFLVTGFMTVFTQVSLSLLSESASQSCVVATYNRRFNLTLRFNLAIACIAGLAISLWPKGVAVIFGTAFADVAMLLPITLAYSAVYVGCATCGQYFSSSSNMWAGLGLTVFWGLVFVGGYVMLGVGAKAQGLALALLLAYWVTLLLEITFIRWRQGADICDSLPWSLGFLLALSISALQQSVFDYAGIGRLLAALALVGLCVRTFLVEASPLLARFSFTFLHRWNLTP